jgi:protein TonB
MDYHVPIYSKKSAAMLKNILEGSFYKNTEVSDKNFAKQFPDYDFTQKQKDADRPMGRQVATREKSPTSESTAASRATLESEGDKHRKLKTSPKLLAKSMPKFPRAAERRGMRGVVEISYKVSTNGRPTDIKIIREEPRGYGFGEASINALEKYRFESATENGRVIESEPQKLRFRF